MDLKTDANTNIKEFIRNNYLVNFVEKPTRVCTKFYKNINATRTSSSIIDLFSHNGDLVDGSDVISCPFNG